MVLEEGQGITVSSSIGNLCSLLFSDDVSGIADTCVQWQKRLICLVNFVKIAIEMLLKLGKIMFSPKVS